MDQADGGAVAKLKVQGMAATEIAKRLKIGRASVYRVVAGERDRLSGSWGVCQKMQGPGRRIVEQTADRPGRAVIARPSSIVRAIQTAVCKL